MSAPTADGTGLVSYNCCCFWRLFGWNVDEAIERASACSKMISKINRFPGKNWEELKEKFPLDNDDRNNASILYASE
jgi:hypothetical protein